MEHLRLILIVALTFTGFQLWEAWQKDYGPAPSTATTTAAPTAAPPVSSAPATPTPGTAVSQASAVPNDTAAPAATAPSIITATSDLFELQISTAGGTLQSVKLLHYPVSSAAGAPPVELLGSDDSRVFVQESGLTGSDGLPTHHSVYTAEASTYQLADGAESLTVPLRWTTPTGVTVEKRIVIKRGSYAITIEHEVINNGSEPLRAHLYEQLKRNDESSRRGMIYTFTGPALSTPEKRFAKFKFDDIKDKPIAVSAAGAWVGIIQHYFVTALIPPPEAAYSFYSKILDDSHYLVGYQGPEVAIAPAAKQTLSSRVYIGPKRHDIITDIAPGLELSVDFGSLWFIAKPLFMTLRAIHDLTGNWGYAIILVTLLLKLLFFPLSAAGYRSMANMRRVQPRMLALRERFGDDRAQLNQAMMKLYKDEKINPLGGCLPILIQIPVFIALYWVLLESVEMRQAPFILWVQDLSEKDPFFVLPLLMGISMWGQQKLNPAPIDPMQAKVMQVMPVMFTAFFAFFPSGLVLYWFVNNMLSIAQQWQITRAIEAKAA
ncbi:MAG: membrane protein insertase YidC [Proteobacteria bacterium]|nr:membrane protein insertase YidC [Pseudomonadota bacterium]